MDVRKFVIHKTGLVLTGQAVCVFMMLGIFALLGRLDERVILGGICGGIIATANFFFTAVGVTIAADRAHQQNIRRGNATIRVSYIGRMTAMALVLFALAKSGSCNIIALVTPLAFIRPILTVTEFFRKEWQG